MKLPDDLCIFTVPFPLTLLPMKVAIVHELLTRRGGAERVAKIFADMFPEAPIYTLLYDEKKLGDWFPKERVRTSSIQNFKFQISNFKFLFNHHRYLKKFPKAVESWNFDDFDLVISSSSAFAHGIITNGRPKHLCYVHSPARYLWDSTHEVLNRADKGILGPLKKWYLLKTFHKLRIWDAEVAPRPDILIANSKEVQRRIELYWRRKSDVITPPIDDIWLEKVQSAECPSTPLRLNRVQSFLIVSTLTAYKNIDIAIRACNKLKLPLTIVGEGPDEKRLKKMAGPTVEFLGYKSNEEVRNLYTCSKAVLFTSNDDFGLVPLEANACGTPVIALKEGGAKETIIDGETGIFFEAPTKESLIDALQNFDPEKFDSEVCRMHAEQYRRSKFEEEIKNQIEKLIMQ